MTHLNDTEVAFCNTKRPLGKEKSREWFLTINNYVDEDLNMIRNVGCRYWLYQEEVGLECGTPHVHAYLYFDNARTFSSIKKKFNAAHIEFVKNTTACIKYCKKEETRASGPHEGGKPPRQGNRSDLEDVVNLVMEGVKIKNIATECPLQFIKFGKGIEKLNSFFD